MFGPTSLFSVMCTSREETLTNTEIMSNQVAKRSICNLEQFNVKKLVDNTFIYIFNSHRKQVLTFHVKCPFRKASAWNVKPYILGKITRNILKYFLSTIVQVHRVKMYFRKRLHKKQNLGKKHLESSV